MIAPPRKKPREDAWVYAALAACGAAIIVWLALAVGEALVGGTP